MKRITGVSSNHTSTLQLGLRLKQAPRTAPVHLFQVNKLYFQDLSHLLSEHGTLDALACYQTKAEHF